MSDYNSDEEIDNITSFLDGHATTREKILYLEKWLSDVDVVEAFYGSQEWGDALPFARLKLEYYYKVLELESGPALSKSPKSKSPKLNEFNQSALNQVQISILFKIMKDKNIISNRDLDKKTYSEIIHQLTGYSQNTLRGNFSALELIEISDRVQDYEEIIEIMKVIIHELEKSKNKINK